LRAIVAAGALLLSATMAQSAMLKGCYERYYDKAHMAKHKGQIVLAMQLQIGVWQGLATTGEEDEDLLAIRSIKGRETYYGTTKCSGGATEASCANSQNAERFSVVKTAKGVKLTLETPVTLVIENPFDKTLTLPRDAENTVYALIKVSDGNCGVLKK
jgi:hypothetical protein